MKKIVKYTGFVLILFLLIGVLLPQNEDSKEKSTRTNKENIIKKVEIEELFKNINDYINKKVTVTGYAPWEALYKEDGTLINIIYSNDWTNELFVNNVEEPINGGYEVIITGKIYKKEDKIHIETETYKINTEVVREESESVQTDITKKSTFAFMREAAQGYANLNWNQLMSNPTSLAQTVIYIPGKVVDMQVKYGITSGLIDTQGNGNMNDLVSFEIKGEVYDFKEGDIIAPMGYIDSSTGLATNGFTNQSVNTPKIIVTDPTLWKTVYYLDLEDEEIKNFMYGTYRVIDENDVDEGLGIEFDFNSEDIGGHNYKYQEKVYLNPSIKVCNSSLMRGYDNIRIGMDITAEGIGRQGANSGLKTTTVSIFLNNGDMSVNSDGGSASKYFKTQ